MRRWGQEKTRRVPEWMPQLSLVLFVELRAPAETDGDTTGLKLLISAVEDPSAWILRYIDTEKVHNLKTSRRL